MFSRSVLDIVSVSLPETITSGYYSFDEAEELFSEQRINLNKNQMDGKEEVFVKEGINLLRIGLNTEDVIRFIGLVGLYPEQAKNIEMSMGIWGPGVDD